MRKVPIMAMAFLVVSFCAFKTPTASAQTETCMLALDVSTTNRNSETGWVNGARATALNTNTHVSIPAVLRGGQPVFLRLPDGQYRITVSKRGFKRAIQPIHFECERMNARATVEVELTRGSFGRSVVTNSVWINADNDNIPPVRRGVTTIVGSDDTSVPPSDVHSAPAPPYIPRAPISGGVLNGKAVSLPRPPYPPVARQAHASGTVVIQVVIDEEGNVISARAVSGHPLLQAAARQAALGARFSPTRLAGQPVKVTGVITYNFVAQ